MCGIVGITSNKEIESSELINRLKKLEYRGYDSWGFADNKGVCRNFIGHIDISKIGSEKSTASISHSRWATHGGVTEANAHPHADCKGEIHIIHNGILDNYEEIRSDLTKKGHKFSSETDSEIASHYFEEKLKETDIKKAAESFFNDVKGEFAILIVRKNDNSIYALKRGSPLVLGLEKDMKTLSSDIYAFSNKTNKAIFFDENEFAIVSPESYEFFKMNGELKKIEKPVQEFQWSESSEEMHEYDHYMIKEIYEQPEAARRLINSLKYEQKSKINELMNLIKQSKRIVFIAAGSSYHATLLAVYFMNKVGIETHTVIASEFKTFTLVDENTLLIAVSQSGETMDIIENLHGMKEKGVKIVSLVNVPHSTIQRMSDISINIMAGQEVCVAATKTFTNQLITLAYIANCFGYNFNLDNIPDKIKSVFEQEKKIINLAKRLNDKKDIYIIGRNYAYPIAREIALKLKEISYIHAEGMMGGELKHGTLALIEEGTPVISLMPKEDENIRSNTKEVQAREGHIISITNNPDIYYQDKFILRTDYELHFCLMSTIIGQILTYYIAKENDLPIDKPRNLAKCCTTR